MGGGGGGHLTAHGYFFMKAKHGIVLLVFLLVDCTSNFSSKCQQLLDPRIVKILPMAECEVTIHCNVSTGSFVWCYRIFDNSLTNIFLTTSTQFYCVNLSSERIQFFCITYPPCFNSILGWL